jgi:uncharacterized protein YidB (DUF937 family)
MGLFDTLAQQAFGGLLGGQSNLLENLLRESGGLSGMKQRFESAGLGEVFASWVGTGENQTVSPSALEGIMGADAVQALAGRVGLSAQMILPLISQFLPQIVDRLTPNGRIEDAMPTADQLQSLLSDVMKGGISGFFGRKT